MVRIVMETSGDGGYGGKMWKVKKSLKSEGSIFFVWVPFEVFGYFETFYIDDF